jgi:hypothetical protein
MHNVPQTLSLYSRRTLLWSFQQQTGHTGSKTDGNGGPSSDCDFLDTLLLQLFLRSNTSQMKL